MSPLVRIVVVSYHTPHEMARCLTSIVRNTPHEMMDRTEVVAMIVCDGSGPPEWISGGGLVRFACCENVGYAGALALGFQEATAPVLVACNADVVFPPDWIKLVWRLTGMPRSPALIGPRQVSSEGMITHGPIRHEGDTDGGRDFGQPDEGQFREVMLEVPQVSGSVMFIEREAFEEVGGMENMPFLYYEDALLCRRLRDAGYWIAYSGLVTFTHDVGASPVTWDRRCEYAVAAHEQWEAECAS